MRQILIFIFHTTILLIISAIFYLLVGHAFHQDFRHVFILSKSFLYTNVIGSLSLLLFFIPSSLKSPLKIISICSICLVLTSILGALVSFYNVWFSNIPEEVVLYSLFGFPLAISNALASLITCLLTAIMLSVSAQKRSKN